jgi:hypothetical protein
MPVSAGQNPVSAKGFLVTDGVPQEISFGAEGST